MFYSQQHSHAHPYMVVESRKHMSLTLMWSDQIELPAKRPSDWTVNTGPHYLTWQHRFPLHDTHTYTRKRMFGRRSNMTAEIAAFINVWPLTPCCPFLFIPLPAFQCPFSLAWLKIRRSDKSCHVFYTCSDKRTYMHMSLSVSTQRRALRPIKSMSGIQV